MSEPDPTTVFESEDLRATLHRAGGGSRPLVITFDSLNFELGLDRPGFGQDWLSDVGYDAVHVVSRRNIWYQYREMGELFGRLREQAAKHPRAVTYGSSMGGYAAIRFAGRVGADTAIAISPQFSIAPARAAFDDRWREHAHAIEFLWDEPTEEDRLLETAWVFFDPHDADRLHVDALAEHFPVRRLPLPYAGHPAGAYLAESGQLATSVLAMIEGVFDPEVFQRGVRGARRSSGQYHFTVAQRQPRRRLRTALRLAQEAARLAPLSAPYTSLNARLLEDAGRLEEAEELHRRALQLEPRHYKFHLDLALLLRTGRSSEAADLVRNLRGLDVDSAAAHQKACMILFRTGNYEDALVAARAALARAPGSRRTRSWVQALAVLLGTPIVGRGVLGLASRASERPASPFRKWLFQSDSRASRLS